MKLLLRWGHGRMNLWKDEAKKSLANSVQTVHQTMSSYIRGQGSSQKCLTLCCLLPGLVGGYPIFFQRFFFHLLEKFRFFGTFS